mgnify:CR=1 FL=1
MKSRALFLLLPAFLPAADLPPDKGSTIPESGMRPVVVEASNFEFRISDFTLPEGFTLTLAAAAPLVTHPIMGCVDDRGRLFIGDAAGVNWNKAQLEANPPNRVLMLEDTDGDGVYEKSTVFADKMTFPQGACWHEGSLYVASPPGIWRLTDKDGDGIAEDRRQIVTGFDYTGNAADVHGPKVHPNGRLYWCHGRKGHVISQKDGTLVHEGKASGIWSCLPDGGDVQWHSLGCADNPTGLAFTPEGDIIGTCNLYYSNPRGDTLMHWLYGGVYERADQMQVIADLPRTLEKMPVIHNFGHVAVSGCEFWHSQPGSPLYVTHFNTQRLVRMDLAKAGASYTATESEFLKIHNPDVHLTDVIESTDGSLLLLDTGGWFRLGCPSGLMAKPDVLGAVYRITAGKKAAPVAAALPQPPANPKAAAAALKSPDAHARRRALEWTAQRLPHILEADAKAHADAAKLGTAIRLMMREPLDPPLEHSLILAAQSMSLLAVSMDDLRKEKNPAALRRMLSSFIPDDSAAMNQHMGIAVQQLDSADAALAHVALGIVTQHPDADEWVAPTLIQWLSHAPTAARLTALEGFALVLRDQPQTQKLLTAMLAAPQGETRRAALRVFAAQPVNDVHPGWLPPMQDLLEKPADTGLPLILDAIKRLKTHPFDPQLQALADDSAQPLSLRLKALDAMKSLQLAGPTFDLIRATVTDPAASAAARIQAATMLAAAPLDAARHLALAPVFASTGPVELEKLLPLLRKAKESDTARALATELAKNPAIASQQESLYRTALHQHPPEIFEAIILPAYTRASEAQEEKKRALPALAEKAATAGRATEGRHVFESGKGTCIACHQIGGVGRVLGPDLSKIGAIRTERDLIESILFPSASLARDYETHLIETADGQTVMGVIRSHTAEGLLVMDVAGQEKNLPHAAITASTQLPASLMPMGLDQTLPEQDLLDLVAWLRSLK